MARTNPLKTRAVTTCQSRARAARVTVSVQGPGNFLRMDCSRQPLRHWTRQGQYAWNQLKITSSSPQVHIYKEQVHTLYQPKK